MANFKDGVIRDGSSAGTGAPLGNIKGGVIRQGSSSGLGTGRPVGNVKDGVVRAGSSSGLGTGSTKGKVSQYSIKGMERESDAEIVAAYHFLVKRFL